MNHDIRYATENTLKYLPSTGDAPACIACRRVDISRGAPPLLRAVLSNDDDFLVLCRRYYDYVLPSCRPRPEPRPVVAPTQDEEIVVVAEYSAQQGRRPSRDVDTSTGSARRSLRPLSHRIT